MLADLTSRLSAPLSLLLDISLESEYCGDATNYRNKPIGVLLAESVDDIVTAVLFCKEHQISVTPRGAGTGLSGGCVPSENALVISTEKLTTMEINQSERIAICGPGLITKKLMDAASEYSLTYPPDPASYKESTLGGNVAENAGGLRCRKFGVTKDYILGLEAVTPCGQLLRTGWFNGGRGFALVDLLIASEGTLAIVTNIAVQLVPKPAMGKTLLVSFPTPSDAARTVTDMTTAGIIPTVLEFLDGNAAECSNQYEKTDGIDNAGAILLIETDCKNSEQQTESIRKISEQNHCSYLRVEDSPQKAEELWKVRRNLSRAVKTISPVHISEDVAVPNSRFPELVQFVAETNERSDLRINSFGHAGDGNLHVYYIAEEGNADQERLIDKEIARLMRKTLELGGTLTGEHGIGLAKKIFLQEEFDSATMDAFRIIKELFDPDYMFNPDKLISQRRDRSLS